MHPLKVKTNKHKLSSAVGPLGSLRRTAPPQNGEGGGGASQPVLSSVDPGLKDGDVVCVNGEELRELLSSITVSTGCARHGPEEQAAPGGTSKKNCRSAGSKKLHRIINCLVLITRRSNTHKLCLFCEQRRRKANKGG